MAATAGGEPWREAWVRSLLRCPVDGAELRDVALADEVEGLACTDAGHRVAYPVIDGVPVLLADDAVPLS
ncbi:hypothetical protein H7K62_14245 [Quadrisphaera sp. RL12-1S]|uniref:Trm112 family protein n=1 Tax=Quadrisphaera sp. RL12-1S TaxID=2763011 RepID=UPI001646E8EA|nr:hypothetical protein [Quadrisphaera sp. RL12-1S]MBC3762855.1 hypothetical protein [Quadrisphaera sp. RL12-1S]